MAEGVPVLMYHHVSPRPGLVTVAPENFRAQMEWLARRGWGSLGADGFAAWLAGAPTPPRRVLITFDDGWLDNWVHAHPVLRDFGLEAVLFLVTGLVGDGPCRTAPPLPDHRGAKAALREGRADDAVVRWSEVEAMEAAGTFRCHSHTHGHRRWDREMPPGAARDAALAEDLARSRSVLAARLGRRNPHLCWPQGYYDDAYLRVAADAGFTHLHTTENRINRPGGDPLRIGRQVVKDKGALWLGTRMALWRRPAAAGFYESLKALGRGRP